MSFTMGKCSRVSKFANYDVTRQSGRTNFMNYIFIIHSWQHSLQMLWLAISSVYDFRFRISDLYGIDATIIRQAIQKTLEHVPPSTFIIFFDGLYDQFIKPLPKGEIEKQHYYRNWKSMLHFIWLMLDFSWE